MKNFYGHLLAYLCLLTVHSFVLGNSSKGVFLDNQLILLDAPADTPVGRFFVEEPTTLGVKSWEFAAGDWVESSPSIGSDGTVYFGSSDHKVYAVDGITGQKKWEFTTGDAVESSPAIGSYGTVYIGSGDGKVYALDGASGAKKWEFATGDVILSSVAISVGGTVYIGSGDGKVYALDGASGQKVWDFVTAGEVESTPAIGTDGKVYIGSWDGRVYALNGSNGEKIWEFATGDGVRSSPAIGSDGTIYVGSHDKKIYALDGTTGQKKWEFVTGDGVRSSPAVGPDGMVYIGSDDGNVYALNGTTGEQKWAFSTLDRVRSSPAIGPDGTIYIGSDDQRVYALDYTTGVKKWEYGVGNWVKSSPAIAEDGTIYIGSGDHKVYALVGSIGLETLDEEPQDDINIVTKKWEFTSGNGVSSSPGFGSDGTVYFGSEDGKVYALNNSTGEKQWEFATGDWVTSSPVIGTDGTIYIGSGDHKVYALDSSTGVKSWEFATEGSVSASAVIGSDGTIYIGSWDGSVYALDSSNGAKKWEFTTGGSVTSSAAFGSNNTIYIGSGDHKLYSLNGATGEKNWEFATEAGIDTSPAIGSDGTIYIGSKDSKLYALDGSTGSIKWNFTTGGAIISSPAIDSSGTIYFGSLDGKVYALDSTTGLRQWEFATGDGVQSSPAIGPDGTLYIGSIDKKVYALDGSTGEKKWEFLTEDWVFSSPSIGPDGIIYVGSEDHKLYALQVETPLTGYSWSGFGRNAQRSALVTEGLSTVTYAFVSGEGDTHNSAFQIDGMQLKTAEDLNFQSIPSYSIRVRAFDSNGNQQEATFAISSFSSYLERSAVPALLNQLAINPQDPVANYHYVFWKLVELVESSRFKTMLNSLGFSSEILDLSLEWIDQEAGLEQVEFVLNEDFDLEEIRAYLVEEVLPTLDSMEARFATIGQSEVIQLYEGGEFEGEIFVDYADSLVLQSLTNFLKCLLRIEFAHAYFEASIRDVSEMYHSGLLTTEYIRDVYPDFGSVQDSSLLPEASDDLKTAIDLYTAASPSLRSPSRTQALFLLYPEDLADEEDAVTNLAKLKQTLDGTQTWGDSEPVDVNLKPFFEGTVDLSILFPDSYGDYFRNTELSDPTFGGLFPGMTDTEARFILADEGLLTDNFWMGTMPLNEDGYRNWWQDQWWQSHWLGIFYREAPQGWEEFDYRIFPTKWMYHAWLGWIYPAETTPESEWLWQNHSERWLWTNKEIYPMLYNHASGLWIYVSQTDGRQYTWLNEEWVLSNED